MLNFITPALWQRMSRRARVTLCVALLSSALLSAQSTGTGSIQGVVSDQTGAARPGAGVTITNRATAGVIHRTTSSDGLYSSGPLQPGKYTVRAGFKGFKSVEVPVTALLGAVSSVNVRLEPGPENQVVKAPGNDSEVSPEQATVQSVTPGSVIDGFPISARNFFDLAQLDPGVQMQDGGTFDPTKNGISWISFQGRFGRTGSIDVDGVDISDEIVGSTTQNIPASAIQEFNLSQSTLDLSTGLTSSGAVSVVTRSGGNTLHGAAFGFFSGNQASAHLPGPTAPTFQQEQFGGRAGGAVIKDTLFWFADVERTKQDLTAAEPFAAPFNTLSTTMAQPFREIQADGRLDWLVRSDRRAFFRFNFDQSSDVRPYGAASSLQGYDSVNHAPSATLGYDFTTGAYVHSVRFEYLRFRNSIADSTQTIPAGVDNPFPGLGINIGAGVAGNCGFSAGGAYCGGPSSAAPQATDQSAADLTYNGSRLIGKHFVRFGATFNRIQGGGSTPFFANPQVGTTSVCLPSSSPTNCVTSADPTAYSADSVFLGNGIGFATPQKAFGYAGGGLGPDNRFEGYVGDSWKIKPHFTLTYGMHYVRDSGRLDSNLGPENTLNFWGNGLGNRVRTPDSDFAPQFGFAWDASGNGKTIIRGGGGLFYENSLFNYVRFDSPARQKQGSFSYTPQVCNLGDPIPFNWPTNPGILGAPVAGGAGIVTTGTNQVTPTFCGDPISTAGSQILALSSAFQSASSAVLGSQPNPNYIGTTLNAANANGFDVLDPNYRTPRSWQMNLGLQHQFGPGTVLSGDFIRNVSEHYLIGVDRNNSGAARSYNMVNAMADRDNAQTANGCFTGSGQAGCMVLNLGQAGAQAAYSAAGLDSNLAVTGGAPCPTCAFPGTNPLTLNQGTVGALDMLEPIGRSVYNGMQIKLVQNVTKPWNFVKTAKLQLAYSYSKFVSQVQDQDSVNLATDNDNPLEFTGPTALDRTHQVSFGGTFELPFLTHISMMGHFYSPIPQNLQLPELTNGGEIFATDWLGSGLGSNGEPEPLPGTQIGTFMRGTDTSNLQNVISKYNTHFAGTLTPAGQCLVGSQLCPGLGPVPVMTQADMTTLGWVMPTINSVAPGAFAFPWLKTLDLRAAWPIKIKERFTVEPSATIFNVFNFSNSFLPGNLPLASLLPGGPGGTLAPNVVGGATGAGLTPFRSSFQSGTYALGAPRRILFGLRVDF
jgi:hypothetical protein